jgi:hemerythrin-like domain-containing protein
MFDAAATEMACVHNMLIRGLNAIYLQAPFISPRDEKSFLHFVNVWVLFLDSHHTREEQVYFPLVEELAGKKGIIDINAEQHHAFETGAEKFITYIQACTEGKEPYIGNKIVQLIDGFGPILVEHLEDEIPTLLSLRRFGDRMMGLHERLAREGEKHLRETGLFRAAVWCLATHDLNYEAGIHRHLPLEPSFLLWVPRNVAWWLNGDWWKFAPCDRQGNMQPLYVKSSKAT